MCGCIGELVISNRHEDEDTSIFFAGVQRYILGIHSIFAPFVHIPNASLSKDKSLESTVFLLVSTHKHMHDMLLIAKLVDLVAYVGV